MTEVEAYMELALYLGIILSLPFIFRVFKMLGKFAVIYFFPPKTITFEIQLLDGSLVHKEIRISDNKALIDAVLNNSGRVIS